MKESVVIIKTTTNNKDTASKIANKLLSGRKVACVHIQNVESHYHWESKIVSDMEYVLTFKTTKSLAQEVFQIIKANHNYGLPEIFMQNVDETTIEYLNWVLKETKQYSIH
jgi:periplasmic divalent cation tolerance protein